MGEDTGGPTDRSYFHQENPFAAPVAGRVGCTGPGVGGGVFGVPGWHGCEMKEGQRAARCQEEGGLGPALQVQAWQQQQQLDLPPGEGPQLSPCTSQASSHLLAEPIGPEERWGPHLEGSPTAFLYPHPSPHSSALFCSGLAGSSQQLPSQATPSLLSVTRGEAPCLFFMLSLLPSAISVPGAGRTPGLHPCYSLCREGCFLGTCLLCLPGQSCPHVTPACHSLQPLNAHLCSIGQNPIYP